MNKYIGYVKINICKYIFLSSSECYFVYTIWFGQLIGGTAMISEEMLKKLTIGTVIKSSVPKRRWSYMSDRERNGSENQILSFKDFGDTIDWFFVGIKIIGQKRFLKCVEKTPVLSLEFSGGAACFYGEKELNNIARYWFGREFSYPKSMTIEDVNLLLGVEVKPSNKRYTFGKNGYSPESFVKHRRAYQGTRVRHLAYSYNVDELPISPATEIVFIDKPYWLASRTVSVEEGCAYFGLGEVTEDGCVNMGHSLFKSTGEVLGGRNIAYVRTVIYVDPKLFELVKLNSGAFRLIKS